MVDVLTFEPSGISGQEWTSPIISQSFKQLDCLARCIASVAGHGTKNGGWMTEERGKRKHAGLK